MKINYLRRSTASIQRVRRAQPPSLRRGSHQSFIMCDCECVSLQIHTSLHVIDLEITRSNNNILELFESNDNGGNVHVVSAAEFESLLEKTV